MSATSLSVALGASGIECVVEEWDGLALIAPRSGEPSFADDDLRRRVLALAREHGFTHVAVELAATDRRAALRRD